VISQHHIYVAMRIAGRVIPKIIHVIRYQFDEKYRNEILEQEKRAAELQRLAWEQSIQAEKDRQAAEAQKQAADLAKAIERQKLVAEQKLAKDLENALKTPHMMKIIKKNAFLDAYDSYYADATNIALYEKIRVLGKEYLTALVKLKGVRVKHIAYVEMLNLLHLDPTNSTLHELTLSFGRLYYAEKRRNKKTTNDDETALANDIHAVIIDDTVTTGDAVTASHPRRRAINRRRNIPQKQQTDEYIKKQQTDEYIDEIEGNWTDN
jgi:hypothetical protein